MITTGSERIPLTSNSWDEVPSDQLKTIVSIDSEATNDVPTGTNATTASHQNQKSKKMGLIYRLIIVFIVTFFISAFRQYRKYHRNMTNETRTRLDLKYQYGK